MTLSKRDTAKLATRARKSGRTIDEEIAVHLRFALGWVPSDVEVRKYVPRIIRR